MPSKANTERSSGASVARSCSRVSLMPRLMRGHLMKVEALVLASAFHCFVSLEDWSRSMLEQETSSPTFPYLVSRRMLPECP